MIKMTVKGLSGEKLDTALKTFRGRLQKHISNNMRGEMDGMHDAVIASMARQRRNAPLTILLKGGSDPLRDTGKLAEKQNYRAWPATGGGGVYSRATAVGVYWGIPATIPMHRGVTGTKFKSLSELVFWLNGSKNLSRPLFRIVTVSVKMARLFAILSGATRRGRRRTKKAIRSKLSPRALQLFNAARGREIPPLKAGTLMVVRPRPYLLDAATAQRPRLVAMLRRSFNDALREVFLEAST